MLADILTPLIERVREHEEEIKSLEIKLRAEEETLDRILQDDIPAVLHEHGLAYAPLTDGRVVSIERHVSVIQKNKLALLNWLAEHGYDSIAKIEMQFSKGTDISSLETLAVESGIDYTKDVSIHPMTLKKVVKDHLDDGGLVPPPQAAIVNIFERAKIKEKE